MMRRTCKHCVSVYKGGPVCVLCKKLDIKPVELSRLTRRANLFHAITTDPPLGEPKLRAWGAAGTQVDIDVDVRWLSTNQYISGWDMRRWLYMMMKHNIISQIRNQYPRRSIGMIEEGLPQIHVTAKFVFTDTPNRITTFMLNEDHDAQHMEWHPLHSLLDDPLDFAVTFQRFATGE